MSEYEIPEALVITNAISDLLDRHIDLIQDHALKNVLVVSVMVLESELNLIKEATNFQKVSLEDVPAMIRNLDFIKRE